MGLLDHSCTEGQARKKTSVVSNPELNVFQQSFISKILNFRFSILLLSRHQRKSRSAWIEVSFQTLFLTPGVPDSGADPGTLKLDFTASWDSLSWTQWKFLSSGDAFEVGLICQHGITFCALQSSLCCRGHPGEVSYCKKKWDDGPNILTSLVSRAVREFSHFANIHLLYALDIWCYGSITIIFHVFTWLYAINVGCSYFKWKCYFPFFLPWRKFWKKHRI